MLLSFEKKSAAKMNSVPMVLLQVVAVAFAQTVEVTVLYSAFNAESQKLLGKELVTVYKKLHDSMILKLLPAGKAKLIGKNGLHCENGPEECDAHAAQACILQDAGSSKKMNLKPIIEDFSQQVMMIACLMANGKKGAVYPVKQMRAQQASRRMPNPPTGEYLGPATARKFASLTNEIEKPLERVPTILIDKEKQGYQGNLVAIICRKLTPQPTGCEAPRRAPAPPTSSVKPRKAAVSHATPTPLLYVTCVLLLPLP